MTTEITAEGDYVRMADLLTIDEALALVLGRVSPLPGEQVATGEAAGRVLARAGRALVDLPPFASSAMDGFVLRAADAPGVLPVGERIAAGRPAPRALRSGEVMAIATGGVVPEGADAVVPIEDVIVAGDEVTVPSVRPGANVRPRGGDVRAGEIVVDVGARLGPPQIGALAASGVASVLCARRPRAVVIATGTELRPPGEQLGLGEIYESNGAIFAAQLRSVGAEVERLPIAADDEDSHRAALERGLAADVLLTSGGVSVGPHDLVRRVEADLGVEEVFWRVAVRPGKPVSFGVLGSTLVFGLPGNPVSSLVGFELFVRPAVLALQGASDPGPRFLPGTLGTAVRRNASRTELLRARTSRHGPELTLEPLQGQDSHMIVRAAGADALVLIPRGEGELAAGSTVDYLAI
jgi:molybdopterin molybdotransferase